MLNHKSILITGGTGSFGKNFITSIINQYPQIKQIVVYSRDEHKQYQMMEHQLWGKHPALRFMIGDIRDAERLNEACMGVDYLVHAAALKHIHLAEHNPMEYIKTNILGAENVVKAATARGIKKVIALSSDKAASPNSLYGATKLCADKIFVAANHYQSNTLFSVVRYGNVMGSNGSVIPFFIEKRKEGILPITHPEMTRFNITPEENVSLIYFALKNAIGGEIFVPKSPSFKITDLALALAPDCKQVITGLRSGEKIHEDMIAEADAMNTIETEKHYIIVPSHLSPKLHTMLKHYQNHYKGQTVPATFKYNSGQNIQWLNVEEIKKLVKKYL